MTFKTTNWEPEQPLPRFADRKTLAAIITHNFFPISHRTLQTWPLTVRRPNRAAVYEVAEALAFAEQKLDGAVSYKQESGDMNKLVKNTPPSNDLRGVDVTAPQTHRERDDDYKGVVAQLTTRWRVIVCKDGMQWIVQQKESSHGGPWRGVSYHTSRDRLLRACGSLKALPSSGLEALAALPEFISEYHKK